MKSKHELESMSEEGRLTYLKTLSREDLIEMYWDICDLVIGRNVKYQKTKDTLGRLI